MENMHLVPRQRGSRHALRDGNSLADIAERGIRFEHFLVERDCPLSLHGIMACI